MLKQKIFRQFLPLVFALLPLLVASAQTVNTGTLRGRVLDQSGAAVGGAALEVTNLATGIRRRTQTDEAGFFLLPGLSVTGGYSLTCVKSGFADEKVESVELRAGETAEAVVTLRPRGEQSTVTVYGTTDGIRSDSSQLGVRLDAAKLDETPVAGRKLTSFVLLNSAVRPARGTGDLFLNNTLFVANGSGRRQTTFSLDGSTGDDAWGRQTIFTNVPLSSVQEATVLTNAFSAEYGRTAGGVYNVVTRTGTNDFHGEFYGLWRPGGVQARAPLATRTTEDTLGQYSGQVSGPIFKDRTHFLVSAEYNRQNRDAVITSSLAPGLFTGEYRQTLFLGRLDHRINDRNTIFGRFSLERFFDSNPSDAVGGIALPSAARTFTRNTYTAQISETATLSNRIVNEVRAQYQLGSPITQFQPMTPSVQFVRPGVATEGESRRGTLFSRQFQIADTVSFSLSKHFLKIGGDFIYSRSGGDGQEFGNGFLLGQFTLKTGVTAPIAQLTVNDVQRFTQTFGSQSYTVDQELYSLFIQDDYKIRRDLTLNLGLRYERQTFSDDENNFAPRIGLAYNVAGNAKTVIRAGYGMYYSQLRANLQAGFSIGGPTGLFSFSAAPGQLGFPTTLAPLPALPTGAAVPARDITIRPGRRAYYNQFFDVSRLRFYPEALLNPYTQQWTLGIEQDLGRKWILSLDYVGAHTINIDRSVDLNSPSAFVRTAPGQVRSAAAADAARPIVPVANGFRRIVGTVNSGEAYYQALQVNLRRQFANRFSLLASYTVSHTINTVEPDAPGQDSNDANLLGRLERGNSLLDQRHRAVISGWYQLPFRFSAGGVVTMASGRPYNITTGTDNNGDGVNNDRPVVGGSLLGRNAGRGSSIYDVGMFVEHVFRFKTDRFGFRVRAEALNLFNHANIVGRNGTYGNAANGVPLATLGQPLGGISNVDPGRQFQFSARFTF